MRYKMAFALSMGLVMGCAFMNIPPALNRLMDLYQASYTKISVLLGALFWSHALMQIPAGMVADRTGIRRTLLISILCMGLGNLFPAAFPAVEPAILGRVITGIGTGLCMITTLKMLALFAPSTKVGAYQAFFGGFFSIGSIGAYLLIPRLLPFGWQWPYLVPGFLCLPLLVMWFGLEFWQPASRQSAPLPLVRIVRIRAGWVLGMYHALSWGSVLTLGSWVPSLLAEVFAGTTAVKFAWGGALVMLISGVGRLSGGFILYRFSPLLIANGSILVLGVVYLGLFAAADPVPIVILAILASWFASINFGAFFHLASRATAAGSMATLLGFVNLLANLGAVLFTFMFGWFKDHLGAFTMSFLVLALICSAAFLVGRPVLRGYLDQPVEDETSRA